MQSLDSSFQSVTLAQWIPDADLGSPLGSACYVSRGPQGGLGIIGGAQDTGFAIAQQLESMGCTDLEGKPLEPGLMLYVLDCATGPFTSVNVSAIPGTRAKDYPSVTSLGSDVVKIGLVQRPG